MRVDWLRHLAEARQIGRLTIHFLGANAAQLAKSFDGSLSVSRSFRDAMAETARTQRHIYVGSSLDDLRDQPGFDSAGFHPDSKRYVKAARLANHRVPKAILLWSRTGNTILLTMGGSSPDRRTCRSFTSSYTPHKLCARLRRPDNFVQTIAKLEPKCVSKRLPRSLVEYRGKIFPMYAPNFFGL